MIVSDIDLLNLSKKYKKPCKFCGKIGHSQTNCKSAQKTDKKCLNQHRGRQEQNLKVQQQPHILNFVVLDVPREVENLVEFGKALMRELGTGIHWDQYEIYRPWPRHPWRQEEVRIKFNTMESRNKFCDKTPFRYHQYVNKLRCWGSFFEMKFNDIQLVLLFRHDLSHEMDQLISRALMLKSRFVGLEVTMWGNYVAVRRNRSFWRLNSMESICALKEKLLLEERTGKHIRPTCKFINP